MIDLRSENVLSLTEATEHLPHRRGGRAVHVATLYRWAQRGVRGIRLEVLQCGGTKVTSLEALQRFFERLSAASAGDPQPMTIWRWIELLKAHKVLELMTKGTTGLKGRANEYRYLGD
jgi:hypothetical protein